jgi:hypothetical protein
VLSRSDQPSGPDRRRALGEEISRATGCVVGVGHCPSGRTSRTNRLTATEGTAFAAGQPMPSQSTVAAHMLPACLAGAIVAHPAVAAAVHTNTIAAGKVAASPIATGEATSVATVARAVTAATVNAFSVSTALQIADLLHAGVATLSVDHRTRRHTGLTSVGTIRIEQKKAVDDRTAAPSRNHDGGKAQVEQVFHGEIPSWRKRRPAAMGRRTDSSETTGGIGRAAPAG